MGLDGFLVSGFPFVFEESISGPQAVNELDNNISAESEFLVDETPASIIISPDNSGGLSDVESFAGGEIQQVDLFVNENRAVNGFFDINYDGNPEFESLDRVQGAVDLQLEEASNFATDLDNATDAIRVLIEEDGFDRNLDPGVSDPNT